MSKSGDTIFLGTAHGNIHLVSRELKYILTSFENAHNGTFEMDVCLTLLMIDSIKSLALAQNEHYLYSASADKTVGVFNIISRKKEDSLDFIHTSIEIFMVQLLILALDTIVAIKLIKHDTVLISCSADKTIAFTNLLKKQILKKFDHSFSGKQ